MTDEFDDIRPYHDGEVEQVVAAMMDNMEFRRFISSWQLPRLYRFFPGIATMVVRQVLKTRLGSVNSIATFQDAVSHVVRRLIRDTTDGFRWEGIDKLDPDCSYLFVSNHRDIAGDSMLLDYALYESGHETVRIAVGDNLVQIGFATDLMKLNKSFFIKRSEEGAKKIYAALMQSSRFIHKSLAEGHSIWIAQSEGRAKDGMDLTDPAIIKMFALAERKKPFHEVIGRLRIVPMAISYEYDPCDVSKAVELDEIDRQGRYVKPEGEDLANLARGLGGYKGQVVLRVGEPLSGHFDDADQVAGEIDRQIRTNLELFPVNYWAAKKSKGGEYANALALSQPVSSEVDANVFEKRLAGCPVSAKDHFLALYANPVVNKYQVQK